MADKVWGLYLGRADRVIVRARSQRAAVELLQQGGWRSVSL